MKKKQNKWNEIFGCYAVFASRGRLYVKKNLKVLRIPGGGQFPEFMVVGQSGKNLRLTRDGLWVSEFPKKLTKIV